MFFLAATPCGAQGEAAGAKGAGRFARDGNINGFGWRRDFEREREVKIHDTEKKRALRSKEIRFLGVRADAES